jgi:1-acyl-sn-glycerol-3-phosphate acyltransferase
MSEYDSIRPFHDHEVPDVVARLVDNPELPKAAARLVLPEALHDTSLGEWITHIVLRHKTRNLASIYDCQMLLKSYFSRLVESTTASVTVSGLEKLSHDGCYLFISNHRDIVMDSSLLNYLLDQAGHTTCRMAVGDNLLSNELAADLMRLNKSFVVERGISGARAVLKSLSRTSSYIRDSLEEGVSIWIAQREGRAKDGWDRTDPALIKMLALAHKDTEPSLSMLLARCVVVPVAVSYELDPCALRKAHELCVTARDGRYLKAPTEDVDSIVQGMTGYKGRVHMHFGRRFTGDFDDPDDLALALDAQIMAGMRVYPTHQHAARMLGDAALESAEVPPLDAVQAQFEADIENCPEQEREYLLLQYANVIRNRAALGVGAQAQTLTAAVS